ncbi:MAG TPA: glycosyltransferase [Methylomirabilota bacterium]|nr:glycosyltransferase [Methylomirabilota bacterium]
MSLTIPESVAESKQTGAADLPIPRVPHNVGVWLFYAVSLGAFAFFVYGQAVHGVFEPIVDLIQKRQHLDVLFYPAVLWTLMGTVFLIFRTCMWAKYRPFPATSYKDAPSLTVVIPAYNEGAMVLKSIESVACADYPQDRLEILVVDDGSTDDTWSFICRAAHRYPNLVITIRHTKNQGKREALAKGFARARGDIIVTIDSDSVIEPAALLALAGPFRNERVGAVAGKVSVYNLHQGLIPRMLQVRYALSFDLLRTVESAYENVFCCPGALTAYRAAAVHRVLDAWRQQIFLGVRCTFGEDRALTNFLFAAGYNSVYQRSAVVHTLVPTTYKKLCKMYLRWDRSYVREELRFARVIGKRPFRIAAIALFDRVVTNLRYPVGYVSLSLLLFHGIEHPLMFLRMLTAVGFMSLLNMFYYLWREHSSDFFYGVLYSYFSLFALTWIFPYAVITVRARSWLTR